MIKKILFFSILFSLKEKICAKTESKPTLYECSHCKNTSECYSEEIKKIETLTLEEKNTLLLPENFKKLFPLFNLDLLKKTMEIINEVQNLLTNIKILEKNIEFQIKTRYAANCSFSSNLTGTFDYITALNHYGQDSFFYREENFDPSKEIIAANGDIIPGKFFCTCSIINPFTKKIVNFFEIEVLNQMKYYLTKYIHSMIIALHANDSARWNSLQLQNYAPSKVKEWQLILQNKPTSYGGINWLRPRIEDSLNFLCGKLGE